MNYQDKSLQSLKLGQATEYAANYDRTLLQIQCLVNSIEMA